MKTVLVLRHAKSSWKSEGLSDRQRPLAKRGKLDAPRMGALLRELDLLPDIIICSDAKRARQTAELVAEACGYEGEIHYDGSLYGGGAGAYLEAIAHASPDASCLMLVGHNPDLEELVDDLTGEYQPMPTAALARVELPIQEWTQVGEDVPGKLLALWRPKELDES